MLVRPYYSRSDDYGKYQLRLSSSHPTIEARPESIGLVGALGAPTSGRAQLVISNSGLGLFDWSINSNRTWLQVTPTKGTAPPGETVDAWADLTGMPAGFYTATLTVTANGVENSPYVIPVSLDVQQRAKVYLPFVLSSQ